MDRLRIAADVPADGTLGPGIPELRTNVLIALAGAERSVIAVTSPRSVENRRYIAAQLAAALAQTGRQVLLLDADVTSGAPVEDAAATAELGAGLSGRTTEAVARGNPGLLVATQFSGELDAQRAAHDITVVACPALLDVPEARAVAVACDGTLLVIADGRSGRDDAVRAAQLLRAVGARALGAVVHRPD